jgi:hypothetical protein
VTPRTIAFDPQQTSAGDWPVCASQLVGRRLVAGSFASANQPICVEFYRGRSAGSSEQFAIKYAKATVKAAVAMLGSSSFTQSQM